MHIIFGTNMTTHLQIRKVGFILLDILELGTLGQNEKFVFLPI